MRNKYYSKKVVTLDGQTFDSKKEYLRWTELLLLEKAGAITELKRQVEYELIPAQYETFPRYGKKGQRLVDGRRCIERSICYVADFVYIQDGQTVVEDIKGYRNKKAGAYAMFIVKRKMMLYFHGIRIKEI